MICQQCGQAMAEWKVREYLGTDREHVIRWWHLCDVCVMEVYGPWLPKRRMPPLEENQMWSSAAGGKTYRKAPPLPPATPA